MKQIKNIKCQNNKKTSQQGSLVPCITLQAFTIVELLVAITIIMILTIGFSNLDFHKQKDYEELNKRVNKVESQIEETIFNSLLGKAVKNYNIPLKRKIVFYSGANSFSLEKWYLSGTNWTKLKTTTLKRPGFLVENFFCKNINDSSQTGSFNGSGEIIFEGKNIFLSGGDCSDTQYQELEIDFRLRDFEKKLIFNTISGNITKLKK